MLQYITTFVSVLLIWGLLKYFKWRKEVYYHLEKIGGPKTYPFIGTLYLFFGAKRSDIFKIFKEVTGKYGPFFRSYNGFRGEIHLMKPEHLELIMSSSIHINKGWLYSSLRPWLGDGLLIANGSKWHNRRKMITPAFHFKILENFMTIFVEKSKLLIESLEEKSDGESFDVYPYITHCALDIICETAMGVTINAKNNNYTKAIYDTGELILKKHLNILQQTPLYPFLADGKAFHKNLKFLHGFTNKVISDRREMLKKTPTENGEDNSMSRKKRLCFLDLLLDASSTLSDVDIRSEVDTFMFGGHDTTTAVICWSLFLFGLNQDKQEKAYREVKGIFNERKTPENLAELNELEYLERCIKETLRLYPSAALIGRVLSQDITIDGYKVPKGTNCNLNIYQVHRNPEIYPDPEKYHPDRFLPENCRGRHPYAYIPFSAGPRNCIGQKFAMYEMKTILASILRSFKIIAVDTIESVSPILEIVLRPEGGLKIALQKRTD